MKDIKTNDEELLLESENDASDYEIKPFDLLITKEDRSIGTLVDWISKGKLIIPDFQRSFVWKTKKQETFIDSISIGIPIPSFIFFEDIKIIDGNKKVEIEIIDGMQRLITLTQFIYPEIMNTDKVDKKINNIKQIKFRNKKFENFDNDFKDNFRDSIMNVITFRWRGEVGEDTIFEKQKAKYEVFKRINTGSESLSSQEVRNAVFMSEKLKKIIKLTKEKEFLNLVNEDKKYIYNIEQNRKHQDEFLIRLLAYSYFYKNEPSFFFDSKERFLNAFMDQINNNKLDIDEMLSNVKKTFEIIQKLNANDKLFYGLKRNEGYKTHSKKINEVFSEALFIYISNRDIHPTAKSIQNAKTTIYKEYEKNKSYKWFFQSTVSGVSVKKRMESLKEFFDK